MLCYEKRTSSGALHSDQVSKHELEGVLGLVDAGFFAAAVDFLIGGITRNYHPAVIRTENGFDSADQSREELIAAYVVDKIETVQPRHTKEGKLELMLRMKDSSDINLDSETTELLMSLSGL